MARPAPGRPGHPRQGLGLSYLRQPIGGSDFVAGPLYTYDDVGPGETDFGLRHFSIAYDRAELLPLLRQARALNPALKIMATPWSQPAWMKTSDSLVGGRFKDDPRVYLAYARSVLSNPEARKYLAGTAFHCYSGDPERQSVLHDLFPQKDVYFTECSGTLSGDPATTFPDTLHWHTRFLTVCAVRNWAKSVITWNLALDPAVGPHNGGCDTCIGVAGNAWNVAFRNPDGSIVLVVVNDDWGTTAQRFNVSGAGEPFSYTLPAGAVATFVLRP